MSSLLQDRIKGIIAECALRGRNFDAAAYDILDVCKEHFAGVALGLHDCEDYNEDAGTWNTACDRVANAIIQADTGDKT